jgi:uncharacterized protein (TIGR02646 family)
MLKINKNPNFTRKEKEMLENLKPFNKESWDKRSTPMKKLKKRLRKKLDMIQRGQCAYCGSIFGITSAMEIEHIAPKGESLYPEFMFHEKNLVGACELCNGVYKKHSKDIVETKSSIYENCIFKIVHPYFDDPDEHFDWDDKRILISRISDKGEYSIKLFELDGIKLTSNRAKEYILNKIGDGYPLSESDKSLLQTALKYHPL